jgi:starvation-inducible outer membrane lipoprotein
MKLFTSLFILALLAGCNSMPEQVKDDGREAADRAKVAAEAAYEDMKEDMK